MSEVTRPDEDGAKGAARRPGGGAGVSRRP